MQAQYTVSLNGRFVFRTEWSIHADALHALDTFTTLASLGYGVAINYRRAEFRSGLITMNTTRADLESAFRLAEKGE